MSQSTISEYIRSDLTSRIGSELGPPADLTLSALAKHYGVSFTPVREALRALVAEGVLRKHENGRVLVNPSAAAVKPLHDAPSSLPSRGTELEAILAAEVIGGSLRGETDYLREEATARRFDVGRTAIRQVFNRLAGRGLLVHVPRCGWRVRRFEVEDLRAYLEVREALELKALDLARPRLSASDLRRMLEGNTDDVEFPRLDNDIHRTLVEASGNRYIAEFFEQNAGYYTALFDYAAPETHVVAEMASQHREVLRAMLDDDWPSARRALSRHIRAQEPIVLELMRRIGRSVVTG
jgi:DNA-binding GntR family transcriptional regulator